MTPRMTSSVYVNVLTGDALPPPSASINIIDGIQELKDDRDRYLDAGQPSLAVRCDEALAGDESAQADMEQCRHVPIWPEHGEDDAWLLWTK